MFNNGQRHTNSRIKHKPKHLQVTDKCMESTFTDLKTKTMTEQEAFNDPEMKTIILLSGYVRELGEGKDYETTTYKLAETLVKVFSIHHVSQQRELLIGLLTKLENGGGSAFIDKEQIVDDYLKAN